jgi:hypothetical protein
MIRSSHDLPRTLPLVDSINSHSKSLIDYPWFEGRVGNSRRYVTSGPPRKLLATQNAHTIPLNDGGSGGIGKSRVCLRRFDSTRASSGVL